ncbi:CPCC family cysteine-rich protein [Streptomyces sp. NPDC019396]|uniref:CPCC family cysteine-rich protein n=1 Tax=Streptomyces sp. NPDC019396 TaxID=3154687 RepID=UPI0033E175A0
MPLLRLPHPGATRGFEICHVCFWEDDGQDEHDADEVRGGPNGSLSLSKARETFRSSELVTLDSPSQFVTRSPKSVRTAVRATAQGL